jgi:hypothetical protein
MLSSRVAALLNCGLLLWNPLSIGHAGHSGIGSERFGTEIATGTAQEQTTTELREVELVCIDDAAVGYATFQSHNQKVVSNGQGIFVTHIRTRNQPYTAQTWRLSRSTDGGRTFSTIYEAVHATNPPVLETDDENNIYLIRPDFQDGHAYLYRFLAEKDYQQPLITQIPRGSAGKYAMVLDRTRDQIYYFAHNNTFHILGLDGTVRQTSQLIQPGKNAVLQYPQLGMNRDGTLHAPWTTQRHGKYLYWDIHHMLSPDGGASWRNLDGKKLPTPVTADDTGPALRISLDDEFECHTWLSSFLVKEGKVHFIYLAQTDPPRQHYMRFDVASARRDVHIQPELRGNAIQLQGLDGFFTARTNQTGSPLYVLMQDRGHVACLVSCDNGQTWQDFAKSQASFNVYSLGGSRQLTSDGYIIGTFTDQHGSNLTPDRKSKVYFFRIKTE